MGRDGHAGTLPGPRRAATVTFRSPIDPRLRLLQRTVTTPGAWLIVIGVLLASSGPSGADPAGPSHVRAESAQVRRSIDQAAARSVAVRELIARLAGSDVIVYVEMTASPQIPRARTKLVAALPGVRFLRIGIHTSMAGRDFDPLLGHELQHAVEIAEREEVRDEEAVRRLYREIGRSGPNDTFETDAALDVERKVRLQQPFS